ncbi:uncharacterized protein LOC128248714 [Octopus bimaculoides]|uniref:uncharacterized protein LOC128248714 n=1 Tax=Octopus bimaculoides TaxID=37653 RepID=UPI0022E27CAB|nr:uncharacterized protein LOC128248714 [Octopus bimaculoides]
MVEEIRKELENLRFNYEVTAERKTHDRQSDAIRTPAEIQEIINNDLSKSMHAIALGGVNKKLIRLVVHEDICYFSYKMRKEQFLSKAMQEKPLKYTKELINTHWSQTCCGSSLMIRISVKIRRSTSRTTVSALLHFHKTSSDVWHLVNEGV